MGQNTKRLKILVTGGNGFIGSNLITRLIKEGHKVYSLDNLSTGFKHKEVDGCEYFYNDILEIESLGKDYDMCYHLAAQSRVQPSFTNPTKSFRSNVDGTRAVCDWARDTEIKIIYAGSCSKHHDPSDSPYAMFKFLGEEVCKLYRKSYNMNIQICRFYNVYGPGETTDEKYGSVIGIWRNKTEQNNPIPIVGDGKQKRDFIHVIDIVDGLYRVGIMPHKHNDAWELGIGVNYSINELASLFKNKYNCLIEYIPDQRGNYRFTLNTNTDAKDILGWNPKDRLKDYILNL